MDIEPVLQDHLHRIDAGDWLEVGTDQGSEQTTMLSDLCQGLLYSVDLDSVRIQRNLQYYQHRSNISFHCEDGLEFIEQHQGQFSLVFLDNFDWDRSHHLEFDQKPQIIQQQILRYHQLGQHMTNLNSQRVHLQQCMAVVPKMQTRSIIIIDDTFIKHEDGIYSGKGGACVPYLLGLGWQFQSYDMGVVFWRQ